MSSGLTKHPFCKPLAYLRPSLASLWCFETLTTYPYARTRQRLVPHERKTYTLMRWGNRIGWVVEWIAIKSSSLAADDGLSIPSRLWPPSLQDQKTHTRYSSVEQQSTDYFKPFQTHLTCIWLKFPLFFCYTIWRWIAFFVRLK